MTNIECDVIDLGNKKKDMQISSAFKHTVKREKLSKCTLSCLEKRRKSNTKKRSHMGPPPKKKKKKKGYNTFC